MSEILFEIDRAGVGVLTISRPRTRNALNWQAMHDFAAVVEAAHRAPDLRALIVTGAGEHFISGGDIAELRNHPSPGDGLRLATLMGDALARLEALPCPALAAVNGPARGGGAEVALACDLRLMDETASIGFVQVRLGIIPGWGGGQRLLRAVGYARALDLLSTGRVLDAAQALALGLVNEVTPRGEALPAARRLAAQVATNPPAAVAAAKRILRAGLTRPAELALQAERAEFPALWDTPARREAMEQFLQKKDRG